MLAALGKSSFISVDKEKKNALKYIACYIIEGENMEIRTSMLIKQLYFLHQQRLNKIFCEFDLTATQTFTLIYLFQSREAGRSVKQKDIEHKMEISNPTVTGILNRLEHKGLIQRVADEKMLE